MIIKAAAVVMVTLVAVSQVSAIALAPQNATFFCVPEVAGGISYDQKLKKWVSTKFRLPEKFILKLNYLSSVKTKDYLGKDVVRQQFKVSLVDVGNKKPRECINNQQRGEAISTTDEWVYCDSSLSEYKFNFETGRYLKAYLFGYTDGVDNDDNTPAISGGTCTKID